MRRDTYRDTYNIHEILFVVHNYFIVIITIITIILYEKKYCSF